MGWKLQAGSLWEAPRRGDTVETPAAGRRLADRNGFSLCLDLKVLVEHLEIEGTGGISKAC